MFSSLRRALLTTGCTASCYTAVGSLQAASISTTTSHGTPPRGENLLSKPIMPTIVTPAQSKEAEFASNNNQNPYLLPRQPEKDNPNYKPYSLTIEPPIARQRTTISTLPWDTRVDNYAWIRDTESKEVINYIECENEYTKHAMSHTTELQNNLTKEMIARIVETDQSVPSKKGKYYYYTRVEKGENYSIHCRSLTIGDNEISNNMLPIKDEEILLDVNKEAIGKDFMSLGAFTISPNDNILAYSTDDQGNEVYNLKFKDLKTGKMLKDEITNIGSSVVWSNDNETVFYTRPNDTWREYQLWCHKIGSDVSNDFLIYEETDNKFSVSCNKSRSNDIIFVHNGSNVTDEVYYINANSEACTYNKLKNTKLDGFHLIAKREQNVEYTVSHHRNNKNENYFYILHNGDYKGNKCENFQLYRRPAFSNQLNNVYDWELVIPHRDDTTLQSINCFEDFTIISQRKDGLPQLRVNYELAGNVIKGGKEHTIEMPESVYDVWNGSNYEYKTNKFRFNYTSMITPVTTFDYYVNKAATGASDNEILKKIKQKEVKQYDSNNYVTWREWATARDGIQIPITLLATKDVYNKLMENKDSGDNQQVPTILTGYGSYGYPYDVYFSSNRLTLVDRGVLFCYGHIRGGGEFGRQWKLDGKLKNKLNTFTDFIECSEHLQNKSKYTNNQTFGVSGGSAGGLLMGACLNMRPDLFKFMILDVPFVDVMNTILDDTIPLTAQEWEEWGNPRLINDYFYIKSYSPYDNIQPMVLYPDLLVLAGLNDPRVKYWEPTKLVCKLREYYRNYNKLYKETYGNDKPNEILLKTNMGAGHSGASGRYSKFKELAFEYAFILDKLGLNNTKNDLIDISNVEIPQ